MGPYGCGWNPTCTLELAMRSLYQDLRFGLRVLLASPGYTAVAVLTLAIGIAANTTVFGWIDALLLHPFPGVRGGGQLAALETVTPGGEFSTTSYRDYRDYRDSLQTVSGLCASLLSAFNVGGDENPRRVWGEFVSGNYFAVLGVKPIRGRALLPEEYGDKPGACPVAVISHRLWQELFAADPGVIGKTIRVNRRELTIIGVAPPDFRGVVPGLALEIWLPMVMAPQLNGQGEGLLDARSNRQMWITARLKPGIPLGQAQAEVVACSRRLAQENPRDSEGFRASLLPAWQGHFGAQTILLAPLQILMAVCFVLFLIVAANVANLQLARAATRQKEFSIRLALGAGPARLARQLLTESLLLAAMGALAAVPLALWAGESLTWLFPPTNLPIGIDLKLNADILGFTILLCAAAAIVTGLAPALHSIRANLNEDLKESGRGATPGAGLHRTRGLLVICELALAFVALTGTGLLARSFQNARAIHPGLDARNVLVAQYQLATFCRTPEQRTQFCLRLHDRLQSLPGIAGVSYADNIPLSFGQSQRSEVQVEGYAPARAEDMRVSRATVAPGFLDVLRIPLLEGRDFTERDDDRATAPVMIVNEAFARRFFDGRSPLGRRVYAYGQWFTIVGMAKDSKYHTLTEQPAPHFYMAFRQMHGGEFWIAFFIRTIGPSRAAVASIRREAAMIDPNAGVSEIVPFEESIAGAVYPQKVAATLLSVLGAVSLLLAAVGLYSVMSYATGQRTNEIGIRVAMGAQPRDVLAMVVRQGMVLTALGLAAGLAAALAATRLLSGMLVNVSATDPMILAGAALFLALMALAASYLPARRATQVDPIAALRCQ
jgi:predicted permease